MTVKRRRIPGLAGACLLLALTVGCQPTQTASKKSKAWRTKLSAPAMMRFEAGTEIFWILKTNKGTITLKLMPEVAPMHVSSTIYLTDMGFYDGLIFHRVIPGFMAQGGCPLGTGAGGPGYQYAGEFSPQVRHDRPFLLSMANAGPNTDGSQFFVTFAPTPHLDGRHTIFGEVVEGQDVVKKLERAGTYPSGKPSEKLVIKKATIRKQSHR
jgi:cyclophilin family peptidyl-prolyl cis-trans isomerase